MIYFQLGKLTVPILKEIVKKQGITPASMKKADLIDAINDHFGV
jgi:ATP-dependent DNA helicase 2 subunit 1